MQINIGHFLEIQKARVHKSHLHELRKRSSVLWWHVLLCIVMREKNDMQGRRAYIWITKKIWNKSSLRKKKRKWTRDREKNEREREKRWLAILNNQIPQYKT